MWICYTKLGINSSWWLLPSNYILATTSQPNQGGRRCTWQEERLSRWVGGEGRWDVGCVAAGKSLGVKMNSWNLKQNTILSQGNIREAQDSMPQPSTPSCLQGRHFESANVKLLKSGETIHKIWSKQSISFRNENINKYLEVPECLFVCSSCFCGFNN